MIKFMSNTYERYVCVIVTLNASRCGDMNHYYLIFTEPYLILCNTVKRNKVPFLSVKIYFKIKHWIQMNNKSPSNNTIVM